MVKQIQLGDVAKDTISGFSGVVVAATEWLHGCRRIALQPQKLNKDGEPIETKTFDEPQVVRMKAKAHKGTSDTGGPRPEPDRGR